MFGGSSARLLEKEQAADMFLRGAFGVGSETGRA
jgi:hypothetical protein